MDADSPQSAISSLKSEQDVCKLSTDKRNYHWLVREKKKMMYLMKADVSWK